MKKYGLYLLVFILPLSSFGRNAKEAFLSMPESLCMEITIDSRMNLISTFENNTDTFVQNKFGDEIVIEDLTENYFLMNSGNSTLQIIVLPTTDQSQLYCLIHTVCGPACDSSIEFYSLSWQKLDTETFLSIAPQEKFIDQMEKFPELSINLMQFQYDREKDILIQRNNSPLYLSREDQEKVKNQIKQESVGYKWNGKKFQEI